MLSLSAVGQNLPTFPSSSGIFVRYNTGYKLISCLIKSSNPRSLPILSGLTACHSLLIPREAAETHGIRILHPFCALERQGQREVQSWVVCRGDWQIPVRHCVASRVLIADRNLPPHMSAAPPSSSEDPGSAVSLTP